MSSAPIALTFSAGLVAAFNPCGFAMLPVLLAYTLHEVASPTERPGAGRLAAGLLFGLTMTLGFIGVFLVFGVLLTLGSRAIMGYMPYVSLLVGAALVLLGAYLLTGHQLHLRWVPGVRVRRGGGVASFFALGVGYALASLSCTLPIFLVAIGGIGGRRGSARRAAGVRELRAGHGRRGDGGRGGGRCRREHRRGVAEGGAPVRAEGERGDRPAGRPVPDLLPAELARPAVTV